jgi:DNA-binding CsgD family transcriptional regulator
MNKFELYGLYCPDNNQIKYVGITKNGLKRRLSSHLYSPTNELMSDWINELKLKNKKPIIKLIREYSNYEELLVGEINEIESLKNENIPLLNILDGGINNPMLGKKHTYKTKKIISEKNKGKIRSNEVKDRLKNTLINKWKNNPQMVKDRSLMMSGKNNPFYNKKHSEETINKLKNAVKKRGGFNGKNNPNYKFNITKDELYELYINKNKTIKEISIIFDCSINTINNNLRKYNINKPKSNIYNLNSSDITKYLSMGLNYVEIGKIFGCSNKIIHKFIKKHNLYVK